MGVLTKFIVLIALRYTPVSNPHMYTLDLCNVTCQLHINKSEGKYIYTHPRDFKSYFIIFHSHQQCEFSYSTSSPTLDILSLFNFSNSGMYLYFVLF